MLASKFARWHKSFHILHQLGGFDNDDARISDLQNLRRGGGGAHSTAGSTRGPHLIMIDESDALNQIGS